MSFGPFFNFNNVRRAELFDNETLKGMNTYRNWGYFTAPIQKIEQSEDPKDDEPLPNTSVKSLFNPVYAVGYNQFMQVRQNAPLLDTPEIRAETRRGKDCSIKALVEASQKNMLGRAVYSYADFMYCKHLGKVPNNYLITLRRFSFPAGDHINYMDPFASHDYEHYTEKHNPDIGRLVTWMGVSGNDMSKILRWDVKMPYKEAKGEFQDGGDGGGDNASPLGTFLNATTNQKYRSQMVGGYAGGATLGYMKSMKGPVGWAFNNLTRDPPYTGLSGHVDSNKIYGPMDVITRTHQREIGLEFNHEIELVFDYELRSYDGINPKMAFLDLLGNILAVTYANGAFWGGAYRGSGASQSNVFANLPIYKLNGNESFSEVVDKFLDSGRSILSSIGGNTGNVFTSLKNIASNIFKGVFSAFLGGSLNALGRPQKNAVNSLFSPTPVGFWHLTIGNPWNPIMSIGNLILDGATVEQYGPLGLDDFPTGIKVTCKLKHGKDRDSTQIEHMFMQGDDRIYTPVDSEVLEMYKTADPIRSEKIANFNRYKAEAIARKQLLTLDGDKKEQFMKNHPELEQNETTEAKNLAQFIKTKQIKEKRNKKEVIVGEEYYFDEEIANQTDSELKSELDSMQRHFYQWFGTNDTEVITTVAKEAAYGSKKSGKNVTGQSR